MKIIDGIKAGKKVGAKACVMTSRVTCGFRSCLVGCAVRVNLSWVGQV